MQLRMCVNRPLTLIALMTAKVTSGTAQLINLAANVCHISHVTRHIVVKKDWSKKKKKEKKTKARGRQELGLLSGSR